MAERCESRKAEVEELKRRMKILSIAGESLHKTAEEIRTQVKPAVQEYLASIISFLQMGVIGRRF